MYCCDYINSSTNQRFNYIIFMSLFNSFIFITSISFYCCNKSL